MRDAGAEPAVFLRVAQEVDHLGELLLRLVDPGHVGEGDPVAGRLVQARLRATELAEDALHAPGPSDREEDQRDEQDGRAEAEEQVLPPGSAGIERHGVDDHLLALQEPRERVRVGKGRDLGLEAHRRLRAGVALRSVERPLDGRPLRRDRGDVTGAHLGEEVRAVGNTNPRGRLGRARRDRVVDDEQPDEPDDPPPPEPDPPHGRLRPAGGVGGLRFGEPGAHVADSARSISSARAGLKYGPRRRSASRTWRCDCGSLSWLILTLQTKREIGRRTPTVPLASREPNS